MGTISRLLSKSDNVSHLQKGTFLCCQYPLPIVTILHKDGLVENSESVTQLQMWGRKTCLFFSLPFLSPSLWPLSCLSLASVSHHEMMIKSRVCQYFRKQTSAKPTCRAETGLHRYCLAITCTHEEVNPREFFSLLICHSCSFPKIVALTVEVAHRTHQGNPPLLWDSYAVLDAQLPWLLVLLLSNAWSVPGNTLSLLLVCRWQGWKYQALVLAITLPSIV